MRVEDLRNTFGIGFQAGAWIAPTGELLKVDTVHVHDIIKNPSKFGTTAEHIQALHDEYNEKIGQEGRAREALIIEVLKRGWVRIRAYRNHWSFTIWDLNAKARNNIEGGVRALVKGGVMDKYADVKLNIVRTDDLKEFEADDIIAGHLHESLENVVNNVARLAQFSDLPDLDVDLMESSLSRIHAKLDRRVSGTISAFRGERTYNENMQFHRVLRARLVKLGYDVTEIAGSYTENYGSEDANEVSERSLFVTCRDDNCENLENDLIQLGKEFGQDSVLIKPVGKPAYLVGTREGGSFPEYGKTEPVGKPKMGKTAEFMSRVRNRPFTFESATPVLPPVSMSGKMALQKIIENGPAKSNTKRVKVTKREWYDKYGGFKNPDAFRKQKGSSWEYFVNLPV